MRFVVPTEPALPLVVAPVRPLEGVVRALDDIAILVSQRRDECLRGVRAGEWVIDMSSLGYSDEANQVLNPGLLCTTQNCFTKEYRRQYSRRDSIARSRRTGVRDDGVDEAGQPHDDARQQKRGH